MIENFLTTWLLVGLFSFVGIALIVAKASDNVEDDFEPSSMKNFVVVEPWFLMIFPALCTVLGFVTFVAFLMAFIRSKIR